MDGSGIYQRGQARPNAFSQGGSGGGIVEEEDGLRGYDQMESVDLSPATDHYYTRFGDEPSFAHHDHHSHHDDEHDHDDHDHDHEEGGHGHEHGHAHSHNHDHSHQSKPSYESHGSVMQSRKHVMDSSVSNRFNYTPSSAILDSAKNYDTLDLMKMVMEDNEGKQMGVYILLRLIYTVISLIAGSWSNSVGLVCIAFHSLFECVGLTMELWATAAAKYQQSSVTTYSFGYGRMEVLISFANAIFLIFVSLFTIEHSIECILEPPAVQSGPVMTLAVIGFILNLIGLIIAQNANKAEKDSKTKNLTGEVLWLRLIADNLSAIGLIISSYLVQFGYDEADPVVAGIISIMVMISSVPLAKTTANILLLASPDQRDLMYANVGKVTGIDGVLEVNDQHFWTESNGKFVGSMRLKVRSDVNEQIIQEQVLHMYHGLVNELTIEIEKSSWSTHSGKQFLADNN